MNGTRALAIVMSLALCASPGTSAEPIDKLVRQLGSTSFASREDASRQLSNLGGPAVPALRRALADPDAEVRRRAQLLLDDIENRVEQLLLAFRAYDLPRPPRDAPFVKFEAKLSRIENGESLAANWALGFLLKPADRRRVLTGTQTRQAPAEAIVQKVDVAKVAAVDVDRLLHETTMDEALLILAFQLHDRGQVDLANKLLGRWRRSSDAPPSLALAHLAWQHWTDRLAPNVERPPVARGLRKILDSCRQFDTDERRRYVAGLEQR